MKVLIRADASVAIGFGHVMRCLTLADALSTTGVECAFVCRSLPGDATALLKQSSHKLFLLPTQDQQSSALESVTDARQVQQILDEFDADWLIVDHYSLDADWEREFISNNISVMAIDDLANRPHQVHALLDQNLGRQAADYSSLVDQHCQCFIGPTFALLRPQFQQHRQASLLRRETVSLQHVLISMGGTDEANATGAILQSLASHHDQLADLQMVTIVMGEQSPSLKQVSHLAKQMPITTKVLTSVTDMAKLMVQADLAIGAGGTTSWERCCLGLPSVVFVLADNQLEIAAGLDDAGAAVNIGRMTSNAWQNDLISTLSRLQKNPEELAEIGRQASQVTDGLGTVRLCKEIFGLRVLPDELSL